MKVNKAMLTIFIFFTLIFAFSSGEDVSWLGIFVNSIQFGLVMSAIVYFIYKIFLNIRKIFQKLNPSKRKNEY